jgi:hypothetical protein
LGTSLFAARRRGWDAIGIELLPIGFFAIEARLVAERVTPATFKRYLESAMEVDWESYYDAKFALRHIPITEGAFSPQTERRIAGYRAYCNHKIKHPEVRKLFTLAGLAILEDVGYTRKDGQYLRWDCRAGKARTKSNFHKGEIGDFDEEIRQKLQDIYDDLCGKREGALGLIETTQKSNKVGSLDLRKGSCLEILPRLLNESIDLVVTSPPYCNRYDYTRSYALELIYLNMDVKEVKQLRQRMLSCTVENKTKEEELARLYEQHRNSEGHHQVHTVFSRQRAVREVLGILEELGTAGELNNANIPRMVRNYLYEMCFVIYEMARILRSGGKVVMVNDNVRYAGEEVPIDIILSDFASTFGLRTKTIWTLTRGKGNSSQQMGAHGRSELRKCVYVWEKA